MMDEREMRSAESGPKAESSGAIVYGAWSSGWMMGIGFGTLVMFIAEDLPNEFYERSRFMLVGAGIIAFIWGFVRARKAGLIPWIFKGGLMMGFREMEKKEEDWRRGGGR